MMFWRRNKNEDGPRYATLNQRLFTIVIDAFIMLMLWMPIENITMSFLYNDLTPTQQINHAVQQRFEKYLEENKPADSSVVVLTGIKFKMDAYGDYINNNSIISLVFEQFLGLVMFVIVILVFWIKKQATPGKMLLSLKIVDDKTLGPPTTSQYLIRMSACVFSLGLGILYAAVNKKKRALHDYIAGTAVIKVKRGNAQ